MGVNTQRLDQGGHQTELGHGNSAAGTSSPRKNEIDQEHGHAHQAENLGHAEHISHQESARQQGEARFNKEPLLPKQVTQDDNPEPLSLGKLLAVVGDAVLKARAAVEDELEKEAEEMDKEAQSGVMNNSAKRNQRVQSLTLALQSLQQVDTVVGDAVQSISKTETESLKSVTSNLRV